MESQVASEAERVVFEQTLKEVVVDGLILNYCSVDDAFSYVLPAHEPKFHVVGYERIDYLVVAVPNKADGGEFLVLVKTEFSGNTGDMDRNISCLLIDMDRAQLETHRLSKSESLTDIVANLAFSFRKDEKDPGFVKFCRFGWTKNDGDLKSTFKTTVYESTTRFNRFSRLAEQAKIAKIDGKLEKLSYDTKTEPMVVRK